MLEGDEGPSVAAARANGILILRLKADASAPAGHFALEQDGDISPSSDVMEPAVDDIALILHTSRLADPCVAERRCHQGRAATLFAVFVGFTSRSGDGGTCRHVQCACH